MPSEEETPPANQRSPTTTMKTSRCFKSLKGIQSSLCGSKWRTHWSESIIYSTKWIRLMSIKHMLTVWTCQSSIAMTTSIVWRTSLWSTKTDTLTRSGRMASLTRLVTALSSTTCMSIASDTQLGHSLPVPNSHKTSLTSPSIGLEDSTMQKSSRQVASATSMIASLVFLSS